MNKVTVIGMDLGDNNHKAVALDSDGNVVERAEVPCNSSGLSDYLKGHPGALLAIETGTHCRWVSDIGIQLGHEVLVGNARKLRFIWQSNRKDDWNDAHNLARVARLDRSLFCPVKLRGADDQSIVRLIKARDVLVKNRTAIVNQVRGFCKSEDARLPSCSAESFANRKDLIPSVIESVVYPLFKVLEQLNDTIKQYDALINKALEHHHKEEAAIIQSIPGVGPVTAGAYLASIGDVTTFGDARDAGAYFGLVPKRDQSGHIDKQLRITKEGNQMVRRLLVTSANYIMGPFGKDSDLRRFGERIAERGGKNARKRAKVAVARKLAVIMTAMLKNRTMYKPLSVSEEMA